MLRSCFAFLLTELFGSSGSCGGVRFSRTPRARPTPPCASRSNAASAMDPDGVQAALTAVALLAVRINGVPHNVLDLSEAEWSHVMKNKDSSTEARLARKYKRIIDLASELDAGLRTLQDPKRRGPGAGLREAPLVPRPAVPPAPPGRAQQLALVPYIPTRPRVLAAGPPPAADPPRPVPDIDVLTAHLLRIRAFYAETVAWRVTAVTLRILLAGVIWLPVLLLWLLLLGFLFTAVTIAEKPEIVITWFFLAVKAVPAYGGWAIHRMAGQFWIEAAAALR